MRIPAWIIGVLFSLCACENEITEIGKRFEDNTRFVEVKRFEIEQSATVRLDSFPTSAIAGWTVDSVMVVGKMADLTSGTITSSAYFEVHPASRSYPIDFSNTYVYDSLTLVISKPRVIAGDTTATQVFHLYRLAEIPPYDEQWPCYTNHDSVVLGERVGSLQIFPQKEHMTYTYFKLSNDWGREIFGMAARGGDWLVDPWTFLEYFKGMAIVPDATNSALFSVSSTFELRCYYHHSSGETPQWISLSNKTGNNLGFFTFSRHEHVPAPGLAGVSEQEPMPFATSGYGVIQGLNGYMLKLDLPFIQEFNSYRTIVKAQVILKPRLENYEDIPDLSRLYLYDCDVFGVPRFDEYGNSAIAEGYPDPTMLPENKRFIFDITDYYKKRVQTTPDLNSLHLLVGLPGFIVRGVDEKRMISGNVNASFARMIVREIPELHIHYIQFK
jgi:hypothetical protein